MQRATEEFVHVCNIKLSNGQSCGQKFATNILNHGKSFGRILIYMGAATTMKR